MDFFDFEFFSNILLFSLLLLCSIILSSSSSILVKLIWEHIQSNEELQATGDIDVETSDRFPVVFGKAKVHTTWVAPQEVECLQLHRKSSCGCLSLFKHNIRKFLSSVLAFIFSRSNIILFVIAFNRLCFQWRPTAIWIFRPWDCMSRILTQRNPYIHMQSWMWCWIAR